MRSVSFVDRLTLEISGTVAQFGICLGDVNSEGGHQIVIGTTEGDLYVFKESSEKEWRKASGLGFITAVCIGDVFNIGRNVVVVVSGGGWLYIFDFSEDNEDFDPETGHSLPVYKQLVPPNVKDIIICDVNNDGNKELVMSLTDRVVRTYKWINGVPASVNTSLESANDKADSSSPSDLTSVSSFNPSLSQQSGHSCSNDTYPQSTSPETASGYQPSGVDTNSIVTTNSLASGETQDDGVVSIDSSQLNEGYLSPQPTICSSQDGVGCSCGAHCQLKGDSSPQTDCGRTSSQASAAESQISSVCPRSEASPQSKMSSPMQLPTGSSNSCSPTVPLTSASASPAPGGDSTSPVASPTLSSTPPSHSHMHDAGDTAAETASFQSCSTPPPMGTPIKRETTQHSSEKKGRFRCITKWEFISQIGTVTLNLDTAGNPSLLIAHPGGAFMKLRFENDAAETDTESDTSRRRSSRFNIYVGGESDEDDEDDDSILNEPQLTSMTVEYEPFGVNRRLNPNANAEILGGFHTGSGLGTRYAIATLDGTIVLVDDVPNQKPVDSIVWNLQVDNQLMCLSRLDATGNGMEEVVVSSWTGQTYIISQDKQAVKFQFEEAISTFAAGMFTLEKGNTQPVLVYVTFNNKIQVYHSLNLTPDLGLTSLIHFPGMVDECAKYLRDLGIDPNNYSEVQRIFNYVLYGVQIPEGLEDEAKGEASEVVSAVVDEVLDSVTSEAGPAASEVTSPMPEAGTEGMGAGTEGIEVSLEEMTLDAQSSEAAGSP